jgi:hypothetical protein
MCLSPPIAWALPGDHWPARESSHFLNYPKPPINAENEHSAAIEKVLKQKVPTKSKTPTPIEPKKDPGSRSLSIDYSVV